jgi:hypothetical protein
MSFEVGSESESESDRDWTGMKLDVLVAGTEVLLGSGSGKQTPGFWMLGYHTLSPGGSLAAQSPALRSPSSCHAGGR